MKRKKIKVWKLILIIFAIILIVCLVAPFIVVRYFLEKEEKEVKATDPGNAQEYSIENVERLDDSPIKGKKILFLGSSVTAGASAQWCSFADYIGKRNDVEVTKEAVSATTLVDEFSGVAFLCYGDGRSYVKRLEKVKKTCSFDAVVVQLSTNDATNNKPLGEINMSKEISDFDTKTVTGAMEYIIGYCQKTWNCPVIFYTGSYYESDAYAAMVQRLHELQEKWDIAVADLYTDEEFNDIDQKLYDLYMYDSIHPTKAGYLEWWTPAIENILYEAVD